MLPPNPKARSPYFHSHGSVLVNHQTSNIERSNVLSAVLGHKNSLLKIKEVNCKLIKSLIRDVSITLNLSNKR